MWWRVGMGAGRFFLDDEDRVYFSYPDPPGATTSPDPNDPPNSLHSYPGTLSQPSSVRRTLDDGIQQTTRYEYNELGRVTKFIDPMGMAMPNGAVTNYQWETNAGDFRPKQIQNLGAGSPLVQSSTPDKFRLITPTPEATN